MRRVVPILLVSALTLSLATVARAAMTESVDFTVKVVRGDKQKKRGGLTLRTVLRVTESSGVKPPPLSNTTLRFPKGAVVNARYFRTCDPAKLESQGPRGCPSSSKIGAGKAQGDARPIVADLIDAKITMYNGKPRSGNPTIIIYAVPDLSSPLTIIGELKKQRSGRYGYVLSVDIPPIPTLPGQPNASVSFFDATTLDRTVRRNGRKIHYIEGPIICDGTFLLLDGAFTYQGGVTNTVYERFTLRGGPRCP